MKIVNGFCLREVMGEKFIVPTGDAAAKLSGIVALNETGEFLFNLLQTEQTEQSLLAAVLEEYDVSAEMAAADIRELLDTLREFDLLIGEVNQ